MQQRGLGNCLPRWARRQPEDNEAHLLLRTRADRVCQRCLFKGARGQSDGEALQLGSLTGLSGSQVSAEILNRSCLWDGGQCPARRSTQDGGARSLPTCGCSCHRPRGGPVLAHTGSERGWLGSRVPGAPHGGYTRSCTCDHSQQCLAGVPDDCNCWY